MYEKILLDVNNGVATVTLNAPEHGNGFGAVLHDEFAQVMYELAPRSDVGAIVVTGAGDTFSAGGDPNYINEITPDPDAIVRGDYNEIFLTVRRLTQNIHDLEQPLIAAVNGDAVGVGATVAVNCDVVIASREAVIADTHVTGGIAAGDGGALMWALGAGLPTARYHLLTGEPLAMERAWSLGLVNEVLPPAEVLPRAQALATTLAHSPRGAIRGTKRIFARLAMTLGAGFFEFAAELERQSLYSEDHREFLRATTEGREPQYRR
jgi:enoyl-CoA hydratase